MVWLWMFYRKYGSRVQLFRGIKITLGLFLGLFGFSYVAGWLGLQTSLGGLLAGLQGGGTSETLLLGSIARRLAEPGTWITLLVLISLTAGGLLSLLLPPGQTNEEAGAKQEDGMFDSPDAFVLLLVLIGCGLALFPEFLYLRDQFGWRMNTIFKFYFQVWILWGLAGTYAFVRIWARAKNIGQYFVGLGLTLVVLMGLVYPVFGVRMKFQGVKMERSESGRLDLYRAL